MSAALLVASLLVSNAFAQSDAKGSGRSSADKLIIAHAILMVFGWTVFLSAGILFARGYREAWNKAKIGGLLLWFQFHRTLNSIGIACTIAAFACIFASQNWTWVGPKPGQSGQQNRNWGSVHAMVGLISCVLAWVQPLNAVFRCHPDEKSRVIFNVVHRGLVTATMIAVTHFDTAFSNRRVALGFYIAFIATYGIAMSALNVLDIRARLAGRKAAKREATLELVGNGQTPKLPSLVQSSLNVWAFLEKHFLQSDKLKYFLLALHISVALITAIVISALIGNKPLG